MGTRRDQPSSRFLALVLAGGNVLVCGAVTALMLVVRHHGSPAASPELPLAETVTVVEQPSWTEEPAPSSTEDHPSTSEEPGPGADFHEVTGPGGMTTHIPATWPTKRATGPGAMQADDPTGLDRVLRYGGSPTPVTDSYDVHADYERQFSANKTDYVSIRLERTDVRGMSAIDWEFEYLVDGVRRHVRSVYWLAGGYEYFVYASAPVDFWPDTQPILDVMLTYSTP